MKKILFLILLTFSLGFSQTISTINNESMPTARIKINSNFTQLNTYKVGGANNLTTVGAIPYVASSGIVTQSGSLIFFNPANYTLNLVGFLELGSNGVRTGELRLNGSTSGKVTLKTANAAGTWSLTLPTTGGSSGQALITDGNGVTNWSDVSYGITNHINVMDYGAVGDGVADDTTAIQSAVSALTSGGVVIFPPGQYKISDAIAISGDGKQILGSGIGSTKIIQSNPAKSILTIATQFPGAVRDIALHYSSGSPGQSGTCAICLTGPSGYEGYNGLIENVYISWAYDSVIINAVPYTVLRNVWAQYTQHFGISIYNTINPDNGDITLEGLKLIQDPLTLGNVAVYQGSSGGLKLTQSKIIGFDYAYDLEYSGAGLNTSIVMIQNNSFEGQTDTGIRLGGSSGLWSRFLITGNQIDTYSQHSFNCMVVANTNFDGLFTGNMCSGYGDVRNPGTYPATGIYFIDTAENWVVTGNTFTSLDTGIYIGATAKNITVGINNWGSSEAKNLVTTTCQNSSSTSTCGESFVAPYFVTFSSSTTETVAVATHGQGSTPMDGGCYNSSGVRQYPDTWTRNGSGDVTITFPAGAAFTGTCGIFNGSGGGGGSSFSLPIATASILGGVKVGSGLAITEGVLSTTGGLSTVTTGVGLTGDGSSGNPVRIDPSGGGASQSLYSSSITGWGTIASLTCTERNITATGVTAGATLATNYPSTLPAGLSGTMYSSTNIIVVRLCNVTSSGIVVSDGLPFSARVITGF